MGKRVGFRGWGIWWLHLVLWLVSRVGYAAGEEAVLAAGQAALDARRYEQAVVLFGQVLHGRDLGVVVRQAALEGRCAALCKQSLLEKKPDLARLAVADCSEVLRLNGGKSLIWRLRGIARLVVGEPEKALINFNYAVQLDPTDPVNLRNRGVVYLGLGRHAEADDDFASALRLDSEQAWNHFNRGVLFGRQGRVAEAEAELGEFVRLRGAKAMEFLPLVLQDPMEKSEVRAAVDAVLRKSLSGASVAETPPSLPVKTVSPVTVTVPSVTVKPPAAVSSVTVQPPAAVTSSPAAVTSPPVVIQTSSVSPVVVSPAQKLVPNPSGLKEYVFKIGSFQDRGNAEATLQALTVLAVPMYQEDAEVGGRMFYRVWVGPFNDEASARAALERAAKLPGQHPEPVRLR
ncbi:MAG: SPOR domain-containing protein [Magnetococcus sp. YQC-5]